MKGQGQVGMIIGVFILVLIGVSAFLPTIVTSLIPLTSGTVITGEGHTPADGLLKNYTFITTNVFQGLLTVQNVSNTTTTFTSATSCTTSDSEYQIVDLTSANISICNYNTTGAITIDYTYAGNEYFTSAAGRSILDNVPLFVGIALLLGTLALFGVRRFI